MQTTIRGLPKEMIIHTISVNYNRKNPDNVYLISCHKCGSPLAQVKGVVTRIYPSVEPSGEVLIIKQCYKCGDHYTFQTKTFLSSKKISVTLFHKEEEGSYSIFKCVICRTPIFFYNHSLIKSILTHEISRVPFNISCPNLTCNTKYSISDLL